MYFRVLPYFTALLAVGVTPALGSGVIVPLYIDPTADCTAWQPLIDSVSANPSIPFYIVINPNSGPGGVTPNSGYQTCIPRLRSASSTVTVVGYVATGEGQRDWNALANDVITYADWGSTFRPSGVFFDQVNPTPTNLADNLQYYTNSTEWAQASFTGDSTFIILNPGERVDADTGYFGISNLVVTAENEIANFSPSQLSFSSSTPANKQAVILTDAPSTPPASLISQLVTTDGIGALYITDDTQASGGNPYDDLPTDLASFVALVAADS